MAEANAERRDEDCEQNLAENFASCCHSFPDPLDLLLGFREREEDGGLTKIFIRVFGANYWTLVKNLFCTRYKRVVAVAPLIFFIVSPAF